MLMSACGFNFTRSAALAFKSRVALYEGSWHKFHGEPELKGAKDPAKHFGIAKAASETVMQEGKHSLFTTGGAMAYQDLFRYPGEFYGNNKENIMVRLYGHNLSNIVASHICMRGGLTDGSNAATRVYVLTALYSDGLPAGKSPLDKNGKETGLLTDTENRDPRLVQTLSKWGIPSLPLPAETRFIPIPFTITSRNTGQPGPIFFRRLYFWITSTLWGSAAELRRGSL